LCVYAVPASLAGRMLPWWSFLLGAGAYTLLLAIDGMVRRRAWRGRIGLPAGEYGRGAPAAVAVTAVAAVIALGVGSTVTVVGTAGRLPGGNDAETTQLGIKPFTTLRGMLATGNSTELFDVRGLPDDGPYLRALTLSRYQPNVGFISNGVMPSGVPADGVLPGAPGTAPGDATTSITIEPMAWNDVWLPVFASPHQLTNVFYSYRYDVNSGIVYSPRSEHPNEYVEQAMLEEPTATELRAAGTDYGASIGSQYLQTGPLDPRVRELTQRITAGATTPFDRAVAIYSYFTTPGNGFVYSTKTGPATSSDALVDFLFNNKTGYCEQYSSAMAVMLRSIGIPTRVAIGFTDGTLSGDHRVISSRDAHAWDEVYFPGYGWITFDPTPLTDGRGRVPSYLVGTGATPGAPAANGAGGQNQRQSGPSPAPQGGNQMQRSGAAGGGPAAAADSGWRWWTLVALLVIAAAATAGLLLVRRRTPPRGDGRAERWWMLATALCWGLVPFFAAGLLSWWLAVLVLLLELAAAPAALREVRRRQRAHAVAAGDPDAADAAWDELLDECRDRGLVIEETDTVRNAASRLIREYGLDEQGQRGIYGLVSVIERSWYAGPGDGLAENGLSERNGSELTEAFEDVRRSLRRNAPLALRARLMPRSVFQRPSSNRRRSLSSMR
ncbi:MAG TPA: DUF3488 and transglutaminase-like domain-containing protein, partial [Pseudonocardiaceae bacterium]